MNGPIISGSALQALIAFSNATSEKISFVLLLGLLWGVGWLYENAYAFKYGVAIGQVNADRRPRDCDFLSSPIGRKDCHYQEVIDVYDARGRPITDIYHDWPHALTGLNWKYRKQKPHQVVITWSKVED
jgi:hypothetical protein